MVTNKRFQKATKKEEKDRQMRRQEMVVENCQDSFLANGSMGWEVLLGKTKYSVLKGGGVSFKKIITITVAA